MTADEKWIPADWPAPHGIVAGTTLRHGGVSKGSFATLNLGAYTGDEANAVSENRNRFRSLCDLPSEPCWLRQVHGSKVIVEPPSGEPPEADAAITRKPGVVCVALTADCLPVIFASADGEELAVAHAGWRGLAGGVLEATVNAMSSDPADLLAWLGPAISQSAFEVGGEVRDRYLAHDPAAAGCFAANERGRWQADLYGLARLRLASAGVEQVSGGEYCTFSEPERFFSHRRDGACGRMASFVFRSR
jgi:YfiH family protein